MGRTARPYRAVRAPVVAPGDELRPRGRVGRRPDEVAPFVAGGRGQWILLAFGGACGPGLADVDQPRTAGLPTGRAGTEYAFGHRQLVHGQLSVLLGVVLADRCPTCFDVDDHQPTGAVAFQPVDPATQPNVAAVIAGCPKDSVDVDL